MRKLLLSGLLGITLTACGGASNEGETQIQLTADNALEAGAWALKLALREYRFPHGLRYFQSITLSDNSYFPHSNTVFSCELGGNVHVNYSDLSDQLIEADDTMRYAFSGCTEFEFYEPADGIIFIKVLDVSAGLTPLDLATEDFTLHFDLTYQNLNRLGDRYNGNRNVSIIKEGNTEATVTEILHYFEEGWDYYTSLSNFTIISEATREANGTSFGFSMHGDFYEQSLDGFLNLTTTEIITFPPHSELAYPNGGSVLIRGIKNSSVQMTFSDTGARLEFFDGIDGEISQFMTWEQLSDLINEDLMPQTKPAHN